MDPASMAAAAVAILSPFVKQMGEDLVKTVGEVAVDKVKGLLSWLKQRFAGDASASKDLTRFESNPEKFAPVLEETLKEKIQADPVFATELKQRVDEVGPLIVLFQKVRDGRGVVGVEADEIRSGKVSVTQDAERVENMVGVKGKIIG